MKRKIALLMAFVLTVSASFTAYAAETGQPGQTTQEADASPTPEADVSPVPDATPEADVSPVPDATPEADVSPVPDATPGADASPVPSTTPGADASPVPDGDQGGEAPITLTPPPQESAPPQQTTAPGEGGVPGESTAPPATTPPDFQVPTGPVGQVDVSIGAALVLERTVTFDIRLTGPKTGTETITIGSDSVEESRIHFAELPDGEYVLTVSAPGFATYTQTILVEGKAYHVSLMTGFLGGIPYEAGLAHPGVLVIGDVNGDGKADAADKEALVDAIDGRTSSGLTDLNGDGRVDLVDLEYFAKAYGDGRDMQAGLEKFVPDVVIRPALSDRTRAEGNMTDLLQNKGSVVLAPAEGGEISKTNPVGMQFDFAQVGDAARMDGILIETGDDNLIKEAEIAITYIEESTGIERSIKVPVAEEGIHFLLENDSVSADRDEHGNIRLNLGSQVAVKRVTILITGMVKNTNLAEISKVEFVNNMQERIPAPKMDIPENLKAETGSNLISLSWDPAVNVTGYEVLIRQGDQQETVMVAGNAYDVTSFGGKELVNYQKYQVAVQSVNGTWRSGYCPELTAEPKPNKKPDSPDNVKAVGKYQSIDVSWKDMDDTVSYNLFYKERDAETYQKVENIGENSYTITGLKDLTEYMVYVTGVNELGESGPSLTAVATTTDLNPVVMPKYKLINTGEPGKVGDHIVNAVIGTTSDVEMRDSSLDTVAGTAFGTVDHDPASYYYANTWDVGGYNYLNETGGRRGLTYEFDQAYEIDTFAFHNLTSQAGGETYARVRYWDENGVKAEVTGLSMQTRTDAHNKVYYVVKLPKPVKAKKLQFGIARYVASGTISIAEVYFYHYDSLLDDIMGLYADDLHTVLREDVTQENINVLRDRINTVDPVSGEYHPDKTMLERELKNAEDILNDKGLSKPVTIHGGISTSDVGRGFGGLNAWQPLGVTAAAGETVMIYVGHNRKKTGENTELQLVATQYNAEAGAMSKTIGTLKVGANEITIPKIWTLDFESGGALYVQYTGGNAAEQYAVRVSGGVQVPRLDLYHVEDPDERQRLALEYVTALETYVSQIEATHEAVHQDEASPIKAYKYDAQTCILGASDILLDTMLLSLPAQQIWAGSAGAANSSLEERAAKIVASMDAMEDMMYLFYQHKGLNNNAPDKVNQIPIQHLNIRYQRMFAGAFMYASGNHIGIGWGSATGMLGGVPVVSEDGKYVSGQYFGWGIAHEIGHCINQGAYAVAEVTNNYFAVLAQAKETNGSVRFIYDKVYDKVTSGVKGPASNVFTQLGMYWQLHLAYDDGYNFKTYENYEDHLKSLFFARVDTYARNASKAPAPGGVALTLEGNKNQDLMRLACAAAEKNILDFFVRWGMVPNDATKKYAEQFVEETRAIYYVSDEARVYRLTHGGSMLNTAGTVGAVGDDTSASLGAPNRVDFTLNFKNIPAEDVLGYEIVRCTISGGDIVKETVGFATGNTFSDVISTMNNRTVYYEVTLIDQYLNRSAVKTLEPLKIQHDGALDKSFWTIGTQNLAAAGEKPSAGVNGTVYCPENPDESTEADKMIDNKPETVYTATAGGNAEITIEFNKSTTVAGLKVNAEKGISGLGYEIQVRSGEIWIKVAEGSFTAEEETIHFANSDKKYVATYAASAMKLVLKTSGGAQVSIVELDVLGPTSDNVDFRRTEGDSAVVIGKLENDYRYGDKPEDVIPAGSIVFAGAYKGNPAYNVVLLFDQDGNIVGGQEADGTVKAQQIILADVPENGDLLDVSDGTWIYWLDARADLSKIEKVRAELYRVNRAETNEGQRLVSDSLFENMPDSLPGIVLDSVVNANK